MGELTRGKEHHSYECECNATDYGRQESKNGANCGVLTSPESFLNCSKSVFARVTSRCLPEYMGNQAQEVAPSVQRTGAVPAMVNSLL
jgi:hypothetical protein